MSPGLTCSPECCSRPRQGAAALPARFSSGNTETPLPTSLETQNMVITKVRLTLKTLTPTSTLWLPPVLPPFLVREYYKTKGEILKGEPKI